MTVVFFLAFFFYLVAGLTLLFIRSQIHSDNASEANEGVDSRRALLGNRRLVLLSVLLGFIMFTFFLFRPFVSTFLSDIYRCGSFEIGF